jgi:hypothetical protein
MRWARMPLPIWTIAGLRIVFGSGMIAVNVAKSVLWSLPLILSLALIQRDCRTFYADFDAGQEKEALQYMKTHPRATIIAMGRKIGVLLFSLKKVGPGTIRSPMVEWTERASRVIAQLVLWTALLVAGWQCVRWKPSSLTAAVFLLVTAAICLPYVVGFA